MTMVVSRQTLLTYAEGNAAGACQTLKRSMNIPCGISILHGSPKDLEAAQQDVAFKLLQRIVADSADVSSEVSAAACRSLAEVVENEELKAAITDYCIVLFEQGKSTPEVIDNAVKGLLSGGEAPEEVKRIFTTGGPKKLLADAKAYVLQRNIDEGMAEKKERC